MQSKKNDTEEKRKWLMDKYPSGFIFGKSIKDFSDEKVRKVYMVFQIGESNDKN